MTREEYKRYLLSKGFTLLKTQNGYPSRGEEDVYTHPCYGNNLYVTHFNKGDKNKYGLVMCKTIGKQLQSIHPSDSVDSYAPKKGLFVWTDAAFVALMQKL